MQSKRYDENVRATIPQVTGVASLIIENTENHATNFHGIRYQGRVISENLAGSNFGSGYITIMCVPVDGVTIPTIQDKNDLIDNNSFLVAVVPYGTFRVAGQDGASGHKDFDIVIKTSRTCAKGGKIIGQVTNTSTGVDMIITSTLSMFETTA